jgi:hypothetical protein
MGKISSYGFTNTSPNEHPVTPIQLDLVSNYALNKDDADLCVLANKTAPIDQEELVTFRTRLLPKLDTYLNIQNPAKVKGGIQYSATVEAVRTTTDTEDSSFRVDEPIVASLSIRHPRSGNFDATAVDQIITRLIGTIYKADGTTRIADMMRGAERPIED